MIQAVAKYVDGVVRFGVVQAAILDPLSNTRTDQSRMGLGEDQMLCEE
jgi:hypothetical protein